MRRSAARRKSCLLLVLSLCLSLLAGCGGKVEQVDLSPVFFPPLPNKPRLQFLKGIGGQVDVTGKEKESLVLFALGAGEVVRDSAPMVKPYGVATHQGKIYVSDLTAGQVVIIDLENKTYEQLKGNVSNGRLKKPVNLDLDEEGRLYVTDAVHKAVLVYDPAGNYVMTLGASLDWKPVDLAVHGKSLYVTDFKNNEVKVLDRENGKLLAAFGKSGAEDPLDNIALPQGIDIDAKGLVRVVNMGGRVVTMDRDGKVVSAFGQLGDSFGMFARPKGIAVDGQDRIFVTDATHNNVQIFTDKGRLLVFFGEPGLPRGSMMMPAAMAVTTDNLAYYQTLAAPGFILEQVVIVVNQFGKDKIAIYGLGEMKK